VHRDSLVRDDATYKAVRGVLIRGERRRLTAIAGRVNPWYLKTVMAHAGVMGNCRTETDTLRFGNCTTPQLITGSKGKASLARPAGC